MSESAFNPNWVSTPGNTISGVLNLKGITTREFAKMLDTDDLYIHKLIEGKIVINNELADKLSYHLGSSKNFWLKRQEIYQIRIKQLETEWVKGLPVNDMQRLGWIEKTENLLNSCLRYFDVSSYLQWKQKYSDVLLNTSFRTSQTLETNQLAVASWIRQGEIQSERIKCDPWDPQKLRDSLDDLRNLTTEKSPLKFIPQLKKICAECGIAVVVLRTPNGCPTSGATKFLTDDKAMIILTFRFLSDDHFWFTFFHEIGHLLLHKDKTLFIEDDNNNAGQEEEEANNFSRTILIPAEFQQRLNTMPANQTAIKQLAKDAGISLGIIVGQLQFLKRLNIKYLNGFKRKYNLSEVLDVSP